MRWKEELLTVMKMVEGGRVDAAGAGHAHFHQASMRLVEKGCGFSAAPEETLHGIMYILEPPGATTEDDRVERPGRGQNGPDIHLTATPVTAAQLLGSRGGIKTSLDLPLRPAAARVTAPAGATDRW